MNVMRHMCKDRFGAVHCGEFWVVFVVFLNLCYTSNYDSGVKCESSSERTLMQGTSDFKI